MEIIAPSAWRFTSCKLTSISNRKRTSASTASASIQTTVLRGREPKSPHPILRTMSIAFIAHDEEKPTLIEFVEEHADLLKKFECMATGSTGERLNETTDLEVEVLKSGSHGGDMMIGAAIAADECDAVIFF